MIGFLILAPVLAFAAVVLVRTAMFTPKARTMVDDSVVEFDRNASVHSLSELIKCKTVSYTDHSKEDNAEFDRLTEKILPELYPNVYRICELKKFGNRSLLYRWKGKREGDPAVLMAHYDVVPADEDAWEKPAFEAIVEDGVMWGRGTLDTKSSFNGVLSAANHLIGQGFQPKCDVYFAFSGGEESSGPGAGYIVSYFKEQGITPSFVLDEGGAVVENVFPGVKQSAAMIGLAEKGYLNLEYTAKSSGGHASAPKPHTPVGILSRACARVEAHPFDAKLCLPVKQMFDTLGRYSTFLYRTIFANQWCFGWILARIAEKQGGSMNALMRTTVAFTMMQGSQAESVIPTEAKMISNIRINPEDTVEYVTERIRKVINDPEVQVRALVSDEASRVSTTDCEGWKKLGSAVASTWKGCVVTPYLMTQCSDSRRYDEISDRVFRFSAQDMTAEEIALIHGNNERIRLEVISRAVEFYIRLMKQC